MTEPTPEQCNTVETMLDGSTACWYPQMGGYASKALIYVRGSCADVYVWSDGEFPFAGEERAPIELHHCSGGQFVRFGELLKELGCE